MVIIVSPEPIGASVLIVEDEPLIAFDIASLVEAADCKVIGPFATVSDAAFAATTDQIDIAVLDVRLRGAPVWPVAEILQALGVPFLFLTGYACSDPFPGQFSRAMRLEKPFSEDRLMTAIVSALKSADPVCQLSSPR